MRPVPQQRAGPPRSRPRAARTPHPLDVTQAPAAPPPHTPRTGAAPHRPFWPHLGPFSFQVEGMLAPGLSGARGLHGSGTGDTRLQPRGPAVRAGGRTQSGLCLGLPGLVQSQAACLGDCADPGDFEILREPWNQAPGRRRLEARATCSPRPRVSPGKRSSSRSV